MKTSLVDEGVFLNESGTSLGKLAIEQMKTGPEIFNNLVTHTCTSVL